MIALLTSRAGLWALAVAAVIAVGGWLYWQGGKEARREADALRDDISAWERVNDADIGSGDPDDDIDWLRSRGGK